jgi:hypothetical protein
MALPRHIPLEGFDGTSHHGHHSLAHEEGGALMPDEKGRVTSQWLYYQISREHGTRDHELNHMRDSSPYAVADRISTAASLEEIDQR